MLFLSTGFLAVWTLLVGGCRNANADVTHALERAGQVAGLVDQRPAPAPSVALVCDLSAREACTDGRVDDLVQRAATAAFRQPGTHLAVWRLGASITDVSELSAIDVPATRGARLREARVQEQRFRDLARASLCPPVRQALFVRHSNASPIVEAIAKIALANPQGRALHVVLVSDAREVSRVGDFECGSLPTPAAWSASLRRVGILPADSLTNVSVHFAHVGGSAVHGRSCPVSVGRERAIRALWSTALTAAGATAVTFDSGLPDIERFLTPSSSTTHARSL